MILIESAKANADLNFLIKSQKDFRLAQSKINNLLDTFK